jgi:hypothetical protein
MKMSTLVLWAALTGLLIPLPGQRPANAEGEQDKGRRFMGVKSGTYVLQHLEWEGTTLEASNSIWRVIYIEDGAFSMRMVYGANAGEKVDQSNIKDNTDKCTMTVLLTPDRSAKDKRAFRGLVEQKLTKKKPVQLLISGLVEQSDGVLRVCFEGELRGGEPSPRYNLLEKDVAKEGLEKWPFPRSPQKIRADRGDRRIIYVYKRVK